MGRAPCCDTSGLKKGPWTPEEDQKLIDYIQKNGYGNWRTLPKNAGLQRCGKSCRLRWTNYLRPDIKRGRFSLEEEETIIQLHSILGNKWSAIAARLPGRTDNEIKNYWNTHIRKKLLRMGIDPVTHSPRLDLMDLSSLLTSNMSHTSNSQVGMHSSSVNPELIRIAASLMSQSQTNEVGEYYNQTQTQFDPLDPTRLIQAQLHNYNQHQQDQLNQNHHHPSLIQLHALQQQLADFTSGSAQAYIPIAESDPSPDPFTGVNGYGPEQSSTVLETITEQSNQAIFQHEMTRSSMKFTPSSSPTHFHNSNSNVFINSSCTSTEDESNSAGAADYSSSLTKMMMKFEIPEILDANEFIF